MSQTKNTLRHQDFSNSATDRLAFWVATFFGSGLAPVAPGTAGSLAALPLVAAVTQWSLITQISLWLIVTTVGTWAAARVNSITRSGDHGAIVIDEVVGMGIAAMACPLNPLPFLIAFGLFRLFDIIKIPPVRQVDQWSKRKAREAGPLWGGFGVMADDVLAGVQALLTYITLNQIGWIPQ
jgi:phosphatidylglycerophosphatase A